MTTAVPPYERVRHSCQSLLKSNSSLPVQIDHSEANSFLASIDVPTIRDFGASLALDANATGGSCEFSSVTQEAAFIVLLHALDFGSGWRQELHAHHGKGAFLTIKPGVEAVFCADPNLTSQFLVNSTTKEHVAKWFGLVDSNGSVPDNLQSLVDLLQLVLQELGRNCEEFGSLEGMVLDVIKKQSQSPTPAGDFVNCLIDRFPQTFNDRYELPTTSAGGKQEVCFYKKAQLVVGEIYHRFRDTDERFRFSDGDSLTAYIDNVICAALRYKKIIVPNDTIRQNIENGVELPKGSAEEVYLRAAALVAIEYIVQRCREEGGPSLSADELGNYLWGGLGKEPTVRKFQRHATKTQFY